MTQIAQGAKSRHDNMEVITSFVKAAVQDMVDKGILTMKYTDDPETTEVYVGAEYPIYAGDVKLIFLVRDQAPSFADPLVGSNYDTGLTLSTLDHKKVDLEYTTFIVLIYARNRYDSKYFGTYISSYFRYYEDEIRAKMSIQDVVRRNISQTVPSYVTSEGEMFVTMVTVTIAKISAWGKGLETTSPDVHTVTAEGIQSVDDQGAADGYIDVKK